MDALSEREGLIARLTMAGRSTASIAAELSLSERSVENFLFALCMKSGAASISEFIALAGDDPS